jgi:hypothetical protein
LKRQHYQITIVGIAIVVAVSVTGGLSTNYFSSSTPLSSEVKSSNTTHDHDTGNIAEASAFPSGSNLTRGEISQLFELFDDQPLEGGQVPPRSLTG